jgi:putative phage-type endonuclease
MSLQRSPEWQAERREYIGASDLPAILGMGYRGEYELALEKRGLAQPPDETWAMAWGQRVQTLAADVYRDLTGKRCRNVRTTTSHPRYPHVRASLDLRVVGERRAVEVKWTSRRLSEPMDAWRVQCLGQLGVTGLERVDILKLSGWEAPVIWTVERDEAAIADLMETAEAWYRRFVLGDELPEPDGSPAAGRYLDRLRGTDERDATDEQEVLLDDLRSVRSRLEVLEKADRVLVQQLKASMTSTGVLRARGARVTWTETKGRTATDWKAVAEEAAVPAEVIERHTSTGEPSTRFAVSWKEEGDGDGGS